MTRMLCMSARAIVMGLVLMTLPLGVAAPALAVQLDKPAPEFTATDTSGKTVTLSALKGKTVVLEWTNDGCPYVAKHYNSGTMQRLQADATGKGVVWLTVISSAPGMQGHVGDLEADKLTSDRKAKPTAVLLDPKGKLGRLYNATTTPHMFVIDPSGALRYMGAIDDKPSAGASSLQGARPYVREALDAITAGQPVKAAATRPYGCSVKYAD